MAPIPILNVKNAWPMASNIDLPERSEKLKLNKNLIESAIFVLKIQKIKSSSITTNKTGINISTAKPRPFFTPPMTTITHKNKKIVCQKINPCGSLSKLAKTALADSPPSALKISTMLIKIYISVPSLL